MFVARELETIEEMTFALQVAYPATFCRKIQPAETDEPVCCSNQTLCRLFRVMFDSDQSQMSWFKFAASLEILNLVSSYTTRQSVIHQYGRLTMLTNEYLGKGL